MFYFNEFRDLFGLEISRKLYSEASVAKHEQALLWRNLLNEVSGSLQLSSSKDLDVDYLRSIEAIIASNESEFFSIVERDGEYIVFGPLPVILKESSRLGRFIKENPAKSFAVLFAETCDYASTRLQHAELQVSSRIAMLASVYVAEKDMPIFQDIAETEKAVSALRNQVQQFEVELESRQEIAAGKLRTDHARVMTDLAVSAGEIAKARDAEETSWETFSQQARDDIEAAKKLAFENEALKAARDVWASKLFRHRVGYWLGLLGLALIISFLLAYYFHKSEDIQATMLRLRKPDGDLPYSLLLLYVIPVLAIGWLLRMFGRFVTSNMVLTEDAEQRQAMLDTYFRLVGDPAAKMEPTDRVLILNAIFRPLPGQQQEDISPPSILDLTQSALGKK